MRFILFIKTLFFLSLISFSTQANVKKVIFDTDMLGDDWHSLIYMSKQPNIDLEGVIISVYDENKCRNFAKK